MEPFTELTPDALLDLLPEWELALRAEDKTPGTIEAYLGGARRYLDWCTPLDADPMTRTPLQTWMVHLLESGNAPGTVLARKQAVKRFSAWLLATGQVPGDPFLGVKGPAQRRPIVLPLTDEQLRALIATCTSPLHRLGERLHHRRDEALIRLMTETGIRAGRDHRGGRRRARGRPSGARPDARPLRVRPGSRDRCGRGCPPAAGPRAAASSAEAQQPAAAAPAGTVGQLAAGTGCVGAYA